MTDPTLPAAATLGAGSVPGSGSGLAGGGGGGGGSSILSDKVNRALEVRTDTPAMRAALDALSNLDSGFASSGAGAGGGGAGGTDSAGAGGAIDARSVRVAIERDALHQALLFESELRSLVQTVTSLRESVTAVKDAAASVGRSIEMGVVCSDVGMEKKSAGGANYDEDDPLLPTAATSSSTSLSATAYPSTLESEHALASTLAAAFRARADAAARAETVQAFLDRFDLSERDSYLLDHYAFEEFDPSASAVEGGGTGQPQEGGDEENTGGGGMAGDGMAFLDALERVRKIRTELVKTFGEDVGGGGGGGDGGTDDAASSALVTKSSSRKLKRGASASSRLGATSALRMMETLASKQERSYERLYNFLQSYLDLHSRSVSHVPTSSSQRGVHAAVAGGYGRGGGGGGGGAGGSAGGIDEDRMDETLTHPFVRRSLAVLKHVPAYHTHTLELIAASRRAEVTRRFLLGLTSGYNGLAPIEMGAHDPVNYVGDMLAFVFRAFSVEAELARGVVDYDVDHAAASGDADNGNNGEEEEDGAKGKDGSDEQDDDETKQTDDSNDDGTATAAVDDAEQKPMTSADVLSHATSGLARPLRSRITQVVASLARHPDEVNAGVGGAGGGSGAGSSDEQGVVGGPDESTSSGTGGHGPDGTLVAHDLDEEAGAARNHLASLYAICGLLLFYRSALDKGVRRLVQHTKPGREPNMFSRGPTASDDASSSSSSATGAATTHRNALVQCVQECLHEAAEAYGASLRVYGATLTNLASLSNESEAALAHGTTSRICDVRLASPGFSADVTFPRDDTALASLSIEFLVETVVRSAMSTCDRLDDAVALRTAVGVAKKAGLDHDVGTKWDGLITDRERALANSLIDTEARKVLEEVGLAPVSDALRSTEAVFVEGMTIASHPGLGPAEVQSAMKEFYDSLYSPPLPSFEAIKDPVTRKYARSKTAERVAESYGVIYDAVTSDRGGYDDLSFLGHDPNQVKTLLSL